MKYFYLRPGRGAVVGAGAGAGTGAGVRAVEDGNVKGCWVVVVVDVVVVVGRRVVVVNGLSKVSIMFLPNCQKRISCSADGPWTNLLVSALDGEEYLTVTLSHTDFIDW